MQDVQQEVQQLVDDLHAGRLSRRQFLKRTALLIGSAATANALLLAASGAPIPQVAEAAGQIQGTAPATPPATQAATPGALEIRTSMVTFAGGSADTPGYLAQPTAPGNYPGVVVIQEWWGIDEHIKNVTERFAKLGYVALAPDLYRGKVAKEPNDAQRLVMQVQRDTAIKDIQGAVDYLNQQQNVAPHNKIGVIGFCWGGGLSMMMSYRGQNVGAVVVFYGTSTDPTDQEYQNVSAPVLGMYGEKDPSFTAAKIHGWEAKFKQFGKINQMIIYPGAAHAFFNDTRPSYVKDAATDAWKRTLAWFQQYLVAGPATAATAAATMSATSGS